MASPGGRTPISFGLRPKSKQRQQSASHHSSSPLAAPSAAARAAFGGQEDVDEAEQQRLVELCFPQQQPPPPEQQEQERVPREGQPDVAQLASSLKAAAVVGDGPSPAASTRASAAAAANASAVAPAAAAAVSVADNGLRADGLKERGNALADSGDFEGALKVFEEAISLLGSGTTARGQQPQQQHAVGVGVGVGVGAGSGGKPHDARSAVLWELKSQCHLQLEQWLEAVQAAERAVELSGAQWPEARHTLGRSLLSFGEVRAAVKVLTELFGADPSNEEVRADLIDANAVLGELRRREADFDLQLSGRAGLDAQEMDVCMCKRNLLARGKAVDSDCTLGMDEEEEAAAALDRARREGGAEAGMDEGDEGGED